MHFKDFFFFVFRKACIKRHVILLDKEIHRSLRKIVYFLKETMRDMTNNSLKKYK